MTPKEYKEWKTKNGMIPSPQPREKGWAYDRMIFNLRKKKLNVR
jgi:hypothetical protein